MKFIFGFLQVVFSVSLFQGSLSAISQETFDPDRIETLSDIMLQDQSHICRIAFGDYEKGITPPPGLLNYVPLVITNNTGLPSSRLYIIGKGENLAATKAFFLQPDLSTGICSLVTGNSVDSNISVKLSNLPSAGDNSYFIYIPQLISGRLYVSIDRPLYMEAFGDTINDPSQTTVQDPNYYTLYQDLEFTLDKNFDLFTNVTNVDYFCLPMTLSSHTYPSGKFYPTLDNLTMVGYPLDASRSNIIKNITNGLKNVDQWSALPVGFYPNPYVKSDPATQLRILAAKLSIPLGENGVQFRGAANTQTFFTKNYLQDSSKGPTSNTNYMTALYKHYQSNTLKFTIFPSKLPAANYTLSSSGTANTLLFTPDAGQPSSPPTRSLDLDNLDTASLLSGAVGDWVTAFDAGGTDAYNTEISKLLSALFTAGFLPHPDFIDEPITSDATYFTAYRGRYFSNPKGFDLNGPWYNLYDQVIHPLLLKTNNFGLGYAYDFDDLLDLAGLLHVNVQTGGILNTAQPYPILRLGPIDTTIPNPTENFGPYTLKVAGGLPSGSKPISIIYSQNSSTAPNLTENLVEGINVTLSDVFNYFQVEFDNIGGETLTYNIYPKFQLVLPTTERYDDTDVTLMNGIVFQTGTNGSTIIISVPNTKDL